MWRTHVEQTSPATSFRQWGSEPMHWSEAKRRASEQGLQWREGQWSCRGRAAAHTSTATHLGHTCTSPPSQRSSCGLVRFESPQGCVVGWSDALPGVSWNRASLSAIKRRPSRSAPVWTGRTSFCLSSGMGTPMRRAPRCGSCTTAGNPPLRPTVPAFPWTPGGARTGPPPCRDGPGGFAVSLDGIPFDPDPPSRWSCTTEGQSGSRRRCNGTSGECEDGSPISGLALPFLTNGRTHIALLGTAGTRWMAP